MVLQFFINIISFFAPTTILKASIYLALYYGHKAFYRWMQGKSFTENVKANGKVVIITGANCGIGKETARSMARRGAKVIMACRDKKRAEAARNEIIQDSNNSNVVFRQLDLSSLKSVRSFCETILAEESKIDILINNAGLMGVDRTLTEDGLEMHMAVNHYGHFLLTNLLLDRIKSTPNSRIVAVSSLAHDYCDFDKSKVENKFSEKYSAFDVYGYSKFANVLFANELARRLGSNTVTVNSLHPGAIFTEIGRNFKFYGLEKLGQLIFEVIGRLFFRTATSGAQTTLYVALEPTIRNISGEYFDNCGIGKMNPKARDPELCKWMWEHSEKATQLKK